MCRFVFSICTFGILLSCFSQHISARFTDDVLQSSINRANASSRHTRGVNTPPPIDCKLKSWTPWSSCDSCRDRTTRFQYLERASQFGGEKCVHSQWDQKLCPEEGECQPQENHCGDMFACGPKGRCIGQQLRCNDEIDCLNQNDEIDCEVLNRRETKCSGMLTIPGAEKATQGYNALSGDFMNRVLDPTYFGGFCEYIYNGEWRKLTYDPFCEHLSYDDAEKYYRKPHNFLSYQIVAQATTEEASDYFEDAVSFLKARQVEGSTNVGVSARFAYVEGGLQMSSNFKFLTNISQYANKDVGFVRLSSKVQTAQFKMRSRDLTLDEDMLWALGDLPDQYDFGAYSQFFNEYGTHYVTEGTMGGFLEYVAVVNKNAMERNEISGFQVGTCVGASFGLFLSETSKLTNKWKSCGKLDIKGETGTQSNSAIEDILGFVKGGHTGSSAGSFRIRDAKSYQDWGKSLKYNPALIDFEVLPIYELVRLSTAAEQFRTKLPHLKMAWEEYMQNFNPCRCAACMNNGIQVLSRTDCSCICKNGYTGQACEETERKGPAHGVWSCWSSWSSCLSGRKTRKRECNNPPPKDGGLACQGSSNQKKNC
ncbi:Complement component C8 alpha chain [Labeo rohita]|uniref:Complement component C8 alpha chain n=1 Tax=Labeo rohita TaxID=84645 RepID=A0ABQ8MWF1_LABRO|nr:complement component C8 alpha chain [Labeo rohita]KAI2667175.1 Complement component C8 alpha chain [Labeo rohita]